MGSHLLVGAWRRHKSECAKGLSCMPVTHWRGRVPVAAGLRRPCLSLPVWHACVHNEKRRRRPRPWRPHRSTVAPLTLALLAVFIEPSFAPMSVMASALGEPRVLQPTEPQPSAAPGLVLDACTRHVLHQLSSSAHHGTPCAAFGMARSCSQPGPLFRQSTLPPAAAMPAHHRFCICGLEWWSQALWTS